MSINNAPSIPPISPYNPSQWLINDDTALTIGDADLRYLKLSGGVESGYVLFNAGMQTTKIISGDGTVSLPSYTFSNDTDCGMYRVSSNTIGFSCSGINRLSINPTSVAVSTNFSVDGTTTSNKILNSSGSVSAPTYSFSNSTDTGMYLSSTGAISLSASGSNKITIDPTNTTISNTLISSNKILNSNGSVLLPSYSFSNSTDTGIYSSSTGTISLSASGTNIFSSTQTDTTIPTSTHFTYTGAAISSSTGASIFSGGVGIQKDLYLAGKIYQENPIKFQISGSTHSTSGITTGTYYTVIEYNAGANTQQEYWSNSSIVNNGFVWTGNLGTLSVNYSGLYSISAQAYFTPFATTNNYCVFQVVLNRLGTYYILCSNKNPSTQINVSTNYYLEPNDILYVEYALDGTGTSGYLNATTGGGTSSVNDGFHLSFFRVFRQ